MPVSPVGEHVCKMMLTLLFVLLENVGDIGDLSVKYGGKRENSGSCESPILN